MAEEKVTKKTEERIYTIPLRKEWLKAPRYKRAKKAIKAIKEFVARHMKTRTNDFKNIKIDPFVSEAIWCRSIKKPPHKITVKVKKEGEFFIVSFVSLPKKFKEEDKKFKKKQKKLEEEKAMKEKEKKKKEEEAKKKAEEEKKKEEAKTDEEKKEEQEKKEKDKLLKKEVPVETAQKFIKPTKAFGAQHRKALEK